MKHITVLVSGESIVIKNSNEAVLESANALTQQLNAEAQQRMQLNPKLGETLQNLIGNFVGYLMNYEMQVDLRSKGNTALVYAVMAYAIEQTEGMLGKPMMIRFNWNLVSEEMREEVRLIKEQLREEDQRIRQSSIIQP
jgi:hypothetical protein